MKVHNNYDNTALCNSLCVRGVQYVIYSTRGVVEWPIKHEAKPSALSATRTLLECCKSHPSARINWLIVTLPDLDRHLLVSRPLFCSDKPFPIV